MINTNSKPYVLILREIERASLLKKILIENNINVIIEPLYKIQPIEFQSINFLNYQSLLITSVNTVKILSQKFSKEELNTIKTYCVGKVTEKYALEAGFNCIKTNSNSGITLAKNVIKNGYSATGYDLRDSCLKELIKNGGEAAESVEKVGEFCDVVFVMVMNGDQIKAILDGPSGLLGSLRAGATLISKI